MSRKRKELFPHKITSVTEILPGYFTIEFQRRFDFIPGQVVAISLNLEDEPRLYSIASDNKQDTMRILFDVLPQGLLTPPLSKMKPGDELLVSAPFGRFTPSDKEEWWIATGTGIAPFVSMVESGLELPRQLLHGSRTLSHFLFQDIFQERLGERYLRFCTKEQAKGIVEGRLTSWLREQTELPCQVNYFLCGSPEMVVEVRDIILSKGVAYEHIMAEIYF
ncbi:ferredoxin--NADP+ reductase/benzoate/toluate 1,2-dioxygenase reductase subunit [Saccharicrinis carchari]|uniref:Ferredoxin--NADP+ reductase/benzoate/toluate 1,2-dioxygenase reductase subunit n=1 Tax=Saccharicrinis carchari TaxID=1168039 RepID=A0A521D4S4_SACCC|nr:FAD-binding oxidoreductase [Saccharicrinis carchari]SMO66091.1 ferredoxin--NADP+ reductase/benzoate/toluate 1,2-dioxygenase reductase subunit [Saccharicrinis carchari]